MTPRASAPLRIAVIAPLRHPLGEPHAGGLEAAVRGRVRLLRALGHRVLVCAVEGSRPSASAPELTLPAVHWSDETATDSTYPDGYLDRAEIALGRALDALDAPGSGIDAIDNHSLHPLPLARARQLRVPMLTTLHTPPIPELVDEVSATSSRLVAVSGHTAALWREAGAGEVAVMHNMIDTDVWRLGPGGRTLAWFGRIVPEKAPHLAIAAARRAGMPLTLAGRVGDIPYFEEFIRPQLGRDIVHVGELHARDLARLVGRSAAVLVTPVWEEPFGLVIAEALAAGTPVAAFRTGGVAEVVGSSPGAALVPMGDVDALATAAVGLVRASGGDSRRRTREDAERRFSQRRMAHELDALMHDVARSAIIDGSSATLRAGARARAAASTVRLQDVGA